MFHEKKRLVTVALMAVGMLSFFAVAGALGGGRYEIVTNANAQTAMGNQTMGGAATNETMTPSTSPQEQHSGNSSSKGTVVRDSETIPLDGKSIPGGDYIHLYDSTPYMIMNGHIAAKLPCDSDSKPAVQILIGSAPNLKPAEFETINELSHPGDLCLYHVDLMSNPTPTTAGANATIITDIAIKNNSTSSVDFPDTSGVVIGVNEIMPIAEEGAH